MTIFKNYKASAEFIVMKTNSYQEILGECLVTLPRILILTGVTERFYSRVIEQRKFPLQREQVSKVQAFHVMKESNGETKQVSAPQSEQASKAQKCHIVGDYNGETRK